MSEHVVTFRSGPMHPLEIQELVNIMAEAALEFKGKTVKILIEEYAFSERVGDGDDSEEDLSDGEPELPEEEQALEDSGQPEN